MPLLLKLSLPPLFILPYHNMINFIIFYQENTIQNKRIFQQLFQSYMFCLLNFTYIILYKTFVLCYNKKEFIALGGKNLILEYLPKELALDLEIYLVLLVELIFVVFQIKNFNEKRRAKFLMKAGVIAVILQIVTGILLKLTQINFIPQSKPFEYTLNLFNIMFCGNAISLWALFVVEITRPDLSEKKKHLKYFISSPFLLLFLIGCFLYDKPLLFKIGEQGVELTFGPFFIVFMSLIFSYLVACSLVCFFSARKTNRYTDKKKFYQISTFVFVPIVCALLNFVLQDSSFIEIGLSVSIIFIYIVLQKNFITEDELTKMNNKNCLLRYLDKVTLNPATANQVYVIIMDINDFKKINDHFGHLEGDQCLIWFSNILKNLFDKKSIFLARYGGDEFIAVCRSNSEKEVSELCKKIKTETDKQNAILNKKYNLSVSIGYAKHSPEDANIKALIEKADKNLYISKKDKPEFTINN